VTREVLSSALGDIFERSAANFNEYATPARVQATDF
jgi:hypothetical protein